MDTYKEIQFLVEAFDEDISKIFQIGILPHIERTEFYFNKTVDENDDQYFTDTIYRCNHAYEGALKEAYTVLTGEVSLRMTPDKIYFHLIVMIGEILPHIIINSSSHKRNHLWPY